MRLVSNSGLSLCDLRCDRTRAFNPDRNASCEVERKSQQPVHEPHLRRGGLSEDEGLPQPPGTLHSQQQPTNHDLRQSHRLQPMLLAHPRGNRLEDTPPEEQLHRPEHRRRHGDNIELGEVAMRHAPCREVVEQPARAGLGRSRVGCLRGRTRSVDEEAVA